MSARKLLINAFFIRHLWAVVAAISFTIGAQVPTLPPPRVHWPNPAVQLMRVLCTWAAGAFWGARQPLLSSRRGTARLVAACGARFALAAGVDKPDIDNGSLWQHRGIALALRQQSAVTRGLVSMKRLQQLWQQLRLALLAS